MRTTNAKSNWVHGFLSMLMFSVLASVLLAAAWPHRVARVTESEARESKSEERGALVIYCGRSESLVGPLLDRFSDETGINVKVKYGRTGPLASLILEEGRRSPADIFYAQDPGGLGLLASHGRLIELPAEVLRLVDQQARDAKGRWVGVTGRLRTISYSTARVQPGELPEGLADLAMPRWRSRIGWAPSNASFQAMITAMRHQLGEAAAEQWLREIMANNAKVYPSNTAIVQAIADGEIDLGLVNHYYVHRFLTENGSTFPVANHVPRGRYGGGDICGAMLISGAGVLNTARNADNARLFIEFLLRSDTQAFFADETYEYPLVNGVSAHVSVPDYRSLPVRSVDLNDLADLEQTVLMLRRVGALR